ncbi:EAL domain-containing protein [bacterium]|nr:EAL domain-containing protein [bacterium]
MTNPERPGGQNSATILLGAALAAAILAGLSVFAYHANRAAREREQDLVRNGFSAWIEERAVAVSSIALWDDAILHLDNAFDAEWSHQNVGEWLVVHEGFQVALALDGADQLIFSRGPDAFDGEDAQRIINDLARPLIANVRYQEQTRGPISAHFEAARGIPARIESHVVARLDDAPVVLTASLVQPDFGAALPQSDRAPIVVAVDAIDEAFLALMSERFLLEGLKLGPLAAPTRSSLARMPLLDADGRTLLVLEWRPERPGTAMLTAFMPVILLMLALLGLLGWRLHMQRVRATEHLILNEARASHLAFNDSLTGLPNRLKFGEKLQRSISQIRKSGGSFAVLCIDLDRFKEVNDTFGHEAGDELIRAAARLLGGACGPDDMLARLGGDEFAIVQPAASRGDADELARRLVSLLRDPVDLEFGRVFVGCSVGVAIIDDPAMDATECFRRADLALYRAKDQGRARHVFFDIEMDTLARGRIELREMLRTALTHGDVSIVYQPQVNHLGDLSGVEALARWTHAERGAIPPSVFVPIAEESGLIDALGAYVLRRAFLDSRRLPNLRIAVNVSATQIRKKDFALNLAELVDETGVDPSRFELEITEEVLLGDDPMIRATLETVRRLGFRIALDDFGTGYSSLSYLQRYPIDKIKIDRSFIANLGAERNADAVVGAIVRLARALNLDVIAEGVETESQRLRVQAAGCGDIQGYLPGRPAPIEEILRLAASMARAAAAPAPPQADMGLRQRA